jgi:hypothetical protein
VVVGEKKKNIPRRKKLLEKKINPRVLIGHVPVHATAPYPM